MRRFRAGRPLAAAALACVVLATAGRCDWVRGERSIAWASDGAVVWRFSFDPIYGKPFFHPVRPVGGPVSLTNFKPKDHPWHYGLWFSWKYINRVNYWEEDRRTGAAQGRTRWTDPVLALQSNGAADIRIDLEYVNPAGTTDLRERRDIRVSAPDARGAYAIDWVGRFTAGPAGAVLDRLAMPGEPGGRINGGYAGLSVRLASVPLEVAFITPDGRVGRFHGDRARPRSAAVGCNITEGGQPVGGIAILSTPGDVADTWYLIDTADGFRFACAALLAPHPLTLRPGGVLVLRYRIAVRPGAWTPEALRAAARAWDREPRLSP